jgi:hypothetical protein
MVQEAPAAPALGGRVPILPSRPALVPLRCGRARRGQRQGRANLLLIGLVLPCSYSWEASVAPPRRRERPGILLQQEGREAAVFGSVAAEAAPEAEEAEETETAAEKKAKRGNFWACLQQQLHHGKWHRKDGCSPAHSRAARVQTPLCAVQFAPCCNEAL